MSTKNIHEKVKSDYNLIADDFSSTRKNIWRDFELFSHFLKNGDSILDLGCGNGRLLLFLKDKFEFEYLGVDQSEKLLVHAKKNFPNYKFIEADISQLPNGIGEFNTLLAIASFHHIDPKKQLKTLLEWKKLMNKDSILVMLNWNLHQKKYLPALLKSIFSKDGFRACKISWKAQIQRYYFAFTKRKLRKLLKKAGFEVLKNQYVADGKKSTIFKAKNILTIAKI